MAVDDMMFGKLLATVEQVTTSVNNLSVRVEKGFDKMSDAFAIHEKEDAKMYNRVELLEEWKDGDDKKDGAEETINGLVLSRAKLIAFIAGLSLVSGAAGGKLRELLEKML